MLSLLFHHGPLSVAVDATTWHNYQSGIIQYHCGQVPNNHAVVIVGYDVSGNVFSLTILEFCRISRGGAIVGNDFGQVFLCFSCGSLKIPQLLIVVLFAFSGPVPYYIVKNSWGVDFGDEGYIYIKKDGNVCGEFCIISSGIRSENNVCFLRGQRSLSLLLLRSGTTFADTLVSQSNYKRLVGCSSF